MVRIGHSGVYHNLILYNEVVFFNYHKFLLPFIVSLLNKDTKALTFDQLKYVSCPRYGYLLG